MRETILNLGRQFEFEPQLQGADNLGSFRKFLVVGMGGSHLAADLIKIAKPELDLIVHKSYGLPPLPDLQERLIIVNSYSGNTEEAIDAFQAALTKGLSVIALTSGGHLLQKAKEARAPYLLLPGGFQPRMALGLSTRALLKIMGAEADLEQTGELARWLEPARLESQGRALAQNLKGYVPVIYTGGRNWALAYNWKIRFNETAKIPAFWNEFPELNHNEMQGWLKTAKTLALLKRFFLIFLLDQTDDPRILKRMELTRELMEKNGLPVKTVLLEGKTRWHQIFNCLVLADWVSFYLAQIYGSDPETVPLIEEFKQRLK